MLIGLLLAGCAGPLHASAQAAQVAIGSGGHGGDVTEQVPVSTWIRSNEPQVNKSDRELFVGGVGASSFRGLVAFDLSGVPDEAVIITASVSVYSLGQIFNSSGDDGDEGNLDVVTLDLREVNRPGVSNGATWETYNGTQAWTTHGGDVGAILSSTSASLDAIAPDDEAAFGTTAGLTAALQAALATDRICFRIDALEAESGIGRNFFVFDGAGVNGQAGSDIGPALFLEYTLPGDLIVDIHEGNGQVELTWQSLPGRSYQVEETSDLTNSNGWTVVATNYPDLAGAFGDTLTWTNPISGEAGSHFLRVGREPLPPPGTGSVETIVASNYTVHITNPGFRVGLHVEGDVVLPAGDQRGLTILGSDIVTSTRLSQTETTTVFRVINLVGQTALVDVSTLAHTLRMDVTLENGDVGAIALETGSPGPAYGLGDRGGFASNANLASTRRTFSMSNNAGGSRWISSFLIFPQQGVAGVFFDRGQGSVTIGPNDYEMKNSATSMQTFYYFVGTLPEVYAAYRDTRIAEGYPGVVPKSAGFELGWESWDALRWNTNAESVRDYVDDFRLAGYPIRWAVTGSGFWTNQGSTVHFGRYDPVKYPDGDGDGTIDLKAWMSGNGIQWLIGQRVNFVPLGGPYSSAPGESGATLFDTSPDTAAAIQLNYLLTEPGTTNLVTRKSPWFPTIDCYLLDGNIPGAADWFEGLYQAWEVDGVKEDTMMVVPDHSIYNGTMRKLAERGALVMARCGSYSAPGTLLRINDTGGASSMTLRTPINYLQYAACGAPNVYSDTVGFGSVPGNVKSTMRHAWLCSLTAGMAVSVGPWNWSAANQASFKKTVDFHYALGPYLYSSALESYRTGYPNTMTPLPIAYPDDSATYDLASSTHRQFQWMIGPSLMAAPLLHGQYATSDLLDVYLPAGTWMDYETGQTYQGPQTLTDFVMPLSKTPVFVGGKGVVVMREADEQPLQAVVYPIVRDGSSFRFIHPDGVAESVIVNNNAGWNPATILVTDTTDAATVAFQTLPLTGAIAFPLAGGHDYELTGGL